MSIEIPGKNATGDAPLPAATAAAKGKARGNPAQLAWFKLRDLYRLADYRNACSDYQVKLPTKDWLDALAHALASAPIGCEFPPQGKPGWFKGKKLQGNYGERRGKWWGLTKATLATAAQKCHLDASAGEIERAYNRAQKWRAKYWPLSREKLAVKLKLTQEERNAAGMTFILGYDHDAVEAAEERRRKKRADQERRRRAKGQISRAAYEAKSLARTKPWEAESISESTWRRRRKKAAGDASSDTAKLTEVRLDRRRLSSLEAIAARRAAERGEATLEPSASVEIADGLCETIAVFAEAPPLTEAREGQSVLSAAPEVWAGDGETAFTEEPVLQLDGSETFGRTALRSGGVAA